MTRDVTGETHWYTLIWFVLFLAIYYPFLAGIFLVFPDGVLGLGNLLFGGAVVLGGLMLLMLILGSYIAIYRDSKALAASTNYSPWWWAWILGSWLITPVFGIPLYLLRRWLTVGLPAREAIPIIGKRYRHPVPES